MRAFAALLVTLASVSAHAVPIVQLAGLDEEVYVNEEYTVDVVASQISEGDEVLSFAFDVEIDGSSDNTAATVASPFFDDSSSFAGLDVAGSAFPGVTGDPILLATLRFAFDNVGSHQVSILGLSSQAAGLGTWSGFFDIRDSVSVLAVERPASVPEPGTLALLGVGLIALRLCGARRSAEVMET